MTRLVSARAGSGAACLFLVYLAGLIAVTNLIFSADVTATTRLPGGGARTGSYGINFAALPAPIAEPAPVVRAPEIAGPTPTVRAPQIAAPAISSVPARPATVQMAAAPAAVAHPAQTLTSSSQQSDTGLMAKGPSKPLVSRSPDSKGSPTRTS